MSKSQILTEDGNHVKILTNVQIDKNLPKYKKAEERKASDERYQMSDANMNNPYLIKEMRDTMTYANLKRIVNEKNSDIEDFNLTVTDSVNEIIKQTSMNGFTFAQSENSVIRIPEYRIGSKSFKLSSSIRWWIADKFGKKHQKELNNEQKDNEKKFDVLAFFSDIHDLLDDDQSKVYINRVSDIIECIGLAEISGQIAYKEKLMRMLVINKLESILYAKGMYKALNEKAIVELCKNSPRALRLDYISNFTRTIPIDVIRKKISVDKMQIFDNYAILHFDPDGTGTEKTDKEKKKEIDAKRDPIMFGLIAGSNKLYFISDWIDDKCDLTLDKVIELTSKEIVESGFLKEDAEIEQS